MGGSLHRQRRQADAPSPVALIHSAGVAVNDHAPWALAERILSQPRFDEDSAALLAVARRQCRSVRTALLAALKTAGLSRTAHFCATAWSYGSCLTLEDLKTAVEKKGDILEGLACVGHSSC